VPRKKKERGRKGGVEATSGSKRDDETELYEKLRGENDGTYFTYLGNRTGLCWRRKRKRFSPGPHGRKRDFYYKRTAEVLIS